VQPEIALNLSLSTEMKFCRRIHQFYTAVRAAVHPEDQVFLKKYLSEQEQKLFAEMGSPEQRHCLDVAYTAIQLAAKEPEIDKGLLVRCALLHDIGKTKGDIPVRYKVLTVLVDQFFPGKARELARQSVAGDPRDFRHALYIYYYHGELGREKLLAMHLSELAEIVGKHHKAPTEKDPLELLLLRRADEQN